ncbi:hypothetical protein HID58_078227 [Brassica napus]|uniref:Uncharacterized protein n=2 Tax=Brassica napus TaxID=3708 RepID=A0ABQ7YSL5_BRANA|nr:hypothetical protein HID58_078227 [Brassica napus]
MNTCQIVYHGLTTRSPMASREVWFPKVTSVRQFRLNSSLYVSGPMARARAPRSFFLCGTMSERERNASRRRYMKLFSYKC